MSKLRYKENGEWKSIAPSQQEFDENKNAVTAQLADKLNVGVVGGLQPQPLRNVGITAVVSTTPRVIDVFDGYVWADNTNNQLMRRPQAGGAWEVYPVTKPVSDVYRLFKTFDGEVLAVYRTKIYKSVGWAGVPANVTWTDVLTANSTTWFLRWGVDGDTDGTRFIATTYEAGAGFTNSRYVKMSYDGGSTWQIVYDSVAYHSLTENDASHLHAVCYDKWADRFYFSEGHESIAGIYVSTDSGATWNRGAKMYQNPSPTTLTATPTGLVCGSDHAQNGLYGVLREDNPMDEEIVQTWSWKTPRDGLIGFAQRGYYEPTTGLVYVGFRSDFADVKPIIAAGTPTSGGLVYTWELETVLKEDRIGNIVLPNPDELLAFGISSLGHKHIEAKISAPGVATFKDTGNVEGGKSLSATSLAAGFNSYTKGAGSTALGVSARTEGDQFSVAIGAGATTINANNVAMGYKAKAQAYSTVIGYLAGGLTDTNAVIIGGEATADGGAGVAIGRQAYARAESVIIGNGAKSNTGSIGGVAIGSKALAHSNSIAIGRDTVTSKEYQMAIGKRHVEMKAIDELNTGGMTGDGGRFYFRKDVAGKVDFCVQFHTSLTPIILASSV